MKLVRIAEAGNLQAEAAAALTRALRERTIRILRGAMTPCELLAARRRSLEADDFFWGYSGHLFGLSIDVEMRDGDEEALRVHGWVGLSEDRLAKKHPTHVTYYGQDWQNYERAANHGMHPEEMRVLDFLRHDLAESSPALAQLGISFAESQRPSVLREAIQAFQRAWLIPHSGELDLRTRVVSLAFQLPR